MASEPKTGGFVVLTLSQIQQSIEGLREPGSTVFFFMAASPSSGGPLGRGAVIVELNPAYPGKKQKKYNVYFTDVKGESLIGEKTFAFGIDKEKDMAKWIKERHHEPFRS